MTRQIIARFNDDWSIERDDGGQWQFWEGDQLRESAQSAGALRMLVRAYIDELESRAEVAGEALAEIPLEPSAGESP
ncbi:MAG TPA: hypothetical protein VGK73_11655 [Polyangiaceae bacterium]